MRKTLILPWTEDWAILYIREEKILKEIFNDKIVDIFHIGSTSIPGIGFAKPIIDILIVVKDIKIVDSFNEQLQDIGYEPRGENGIAGRRYFPKGQEHRTHHVHIYQVGHVNIKTHLDFKDYLMAHREDAASYGDLKRRLAKQFPEDHYKYQEEKQVIVDELVKKAIKWALECKGG
ncbi:GrpB family protein [Bacillus sp. FJAT-49732]|uniref:GrpB family protein n=1 Tax=Lederbergia citrisecunda TaxID=2833583 RepID=A0A942YML1_9BACI|nr:GrpB family protein [Lederbergia citrisecunda]MBS4201782.1 GrpB family protein [Lederbergia citrisecunda]